MKVVKTFGIVLLVLVFVTSCARKKTLDDWSRELVRTITIGSAVELGLRQASALDFDVDTHCIQQVRYVDDKSVLQSEQMEFFTEACPTDKSLLSGSHRVARFTTHSVGGSVVEFGNDIAKPFGRVSEESTFTDSRLLLDSLCDFSVGDSNYASNCSVVVTAGKITEIKSK